MSGICDTCQLNQVCCRPMGVKDSCWMYVSDKKSNYEKLFGTPKRAAQTLTHVCQFTHGGELCDRCRLYVFNECDGVLRLMTEQTIYDALLEWLEQEVMRDGVQDDSQLR